MDQVSALAAQAWEALRSGWDGIAARLPPEAGSGFALVLVFLVLVSAAARMGIGTGLARGWRRLRRKRSRRRDFTLVGKRPTPGSGPANWRDRGPDLSDAAEQLRAVTRVEFEKVRLLNASEARFLPVLERVARDQGTGLRVLAQVSLGELIRPAAGGSDRVRRAAHASINSKRLDFAIVDRSGLLVVAIEYQGGGHYQGDAALRDAVKREALRRAGVQMIEIAADEPLEAVAARVGALLSRRGPA